MTADNLCNAALAERGEHLCKLMLREDGNIPGELWSWSVYIDGNSHRRGPGSTRSDPLKWYATLPKGEHRVVVREEDPTKKHRQESNTLYFIVELQQELVINVAFNEGEVVLSLAE
ncbi:hypothetical protein [Polaromonas aquatica]|uniref:hypothetical protein n=1 Tax=Polaromonas aquatica TaxID=332657 RepID=UPI003D661AC5